MDNRINKINILGDININETIWRYIDFTKLLLLLEKESLYFTRVDKLNDPFEGSASKQNVKHRPILYKNLIEKNKDWPRQIGRTNEQIRKFILVNCWHINENESAAMWKIYLKSNEGIAIKSNVRNLLESISADTIKSLSIGKVNYIDYSIDWLPEGNLLYSVIHKRKSFSFENELRLIHIEFKEKESEPGENMPEIILDEPIYEHGKYFKVNIDKLIEKIYIAPTSPDWFKDLVSSLLMRYRLQKEVVKSNLDDDPVF